MLIVAGDFGCIFGLGLKDEAKLDELAALPFTILFLDGNHECFPRIQEYPEEIWHGGRVHRVRRNVLHLMRGQVFEVEGLSMFTMGGGYSIDQMYRIPGRSWWPQELPAAEEYAEGWKNLQKHGGTVDIIVSHAAPEGGMKLFIQKGVFSHRFVQEMELNAYLEKVRQTVPHRHYYFGHMHKDMELAPKLTALYYDVYDVHTGKRLEPVNGVTDA